jgi:hypothetical protein
MNTPYTFAEQRQIATIVSLVTGHTVPLYEHPGFFLFDLPTKAICVDSTGVGLYCNVEDFYEQRPDSCIAFVAAGSDRVTPSDESPTQKA